MKVALKTVKYVVVTLLSIGLCFYAYVLFAKHILKQDVPKVFGMATLVIGSGSMEPNIYKGDLIIIQQADEYKEKDVITFKDGGSVTTHRIVEVTENGYVTRGDANNTNDKEIVPFNHVHGKVVSVLPGVGAFFELLISPFGLVCIVIAGAVLMFAEPVINQLQERKGGQYR